MDRPRSPRHRRRDPQRTGPIRNAGEALRNGEPWRDTERRGDDTVSRGVREGYRVIEEQIRRGQRMAQELGDEPWCGDRYGGRGLPGGPARHLEHLLREILGQILSLRPNPWRLAELLLQLQIEAISELARLGFGALGTLGRAAPRWGDSYEDDVYRVTRDVDEGLYGFDDDDEEPWIDEPRIWPVAPSTPTTIRSTVPIPVYVSSHEPTEVDLDLPAGAQSLELEVEPLVVSGTGRPEVPAPAFKAEFIDLADGPALLRIEVPRDLPPGRYLRRILVRATEEPVGDLTVQVGILPVAAPPKATAKARKKR